MIILATVLGMWIAIENRGLEDEDSDSSDFQDSENRTAFFYDKNIESIFFDGDKIYFVNPAPGHSGFNFFLVMTGITLVMYALYSDISTGDEFNDMIAKLALVVLVISLIMAVWVSAQNYSMAKEWNKEDSDYEKSRDMYESIVLVDYLNTALVFFAPALLLFSLYRERVPDPDDLQRYVATAGIVIMIVSLLLGIIAGFLTRKMAGADDYKDLAGYYTQKAFIAQLFPYLSYLGIGCMLFPFSSHYVRERFSGSLPTMLTTGALVLIIIGTLVQIYPAMLFNDVANEYETIWTEETGGDEFGDAIDTYYEGTAYCYFGTVLALMGIGILMFVFLFGHYQENNDSSTLQSLNIVFMVMLMIGVLLGIWVGVMKMDLNDDNGKNFLTFEYFYVVLMFGSIGMMVYLMTLKEDLFSDVKHFCPNCDEEVVYYQEHEGYWCETCQELHYEPVERRIRKCPDCAWDMNLVMEHHRWYCPSCEGYKMKEIQAGRKRRKGRAGAKGRSAGKKRSGAGGRRRTSGKGRSAAGKKEGSVKGKGAGKKRVPKCRHCQDRMTFVKEYEMWYCYTCERYASPKQREGAGRSSGSHDGSHRSTGGAEKRSSGGRSDHNHRERTITQSSRWEVFTCPKCGKSGEIKTNKRPLNINCSRCGTTSTLR